MNTRTRIMSGVTALALASGAIIMAPAAQAGSPVNGDKYVVKTMSKVVKLARQSEKSLKRAESTCVKISGMSETDERREMLIERVVVMYDNGNERMLQADTLYHQVVVDYDIPRQASAAENAAAHLEMAYISSDDAYVTCMAIPDVAESTQGHRSSSLVAST